MAMVDDGVLLAGEGPGTRPDPSGEPSFGVVGAAPQVATLVFDRESRLTAIGGSELSRRGWSPAQLLGRRLDEVPLGDAQTTLAALGSAALAGETRSLRQRGPSRGRVDEVDVAPTYAADGTIDGGIVVVRDVSDEVSRLAASVDSAQRFQQLADASTDMQALYDPEGVYLEVSAASRVLFGWEPDELVGTSSYDLFHPDDLAAIRRAHQAIVAGPGTETLDYRLRCADGRYRWVEVNCRRLTDDRTGEVVAVQCTTRDITDRRAAEQRLETSERRLRVAMVNAPIGMAIVGLDGRCLEVNDALCRILGRSAEELSELTFHTFTHPDDLAADVGLLAELLAGGRLSYELEKRYLRPDGTVVACQLYVALIHDADGGAEHFVAQVVDLSEREQEQSRAAALTAELERSNEELVRFASTASHDLRSPLATARGLLDLLPRLLADRLDADASEILDRARRQLSRLTDTVDGLLELARVGSVGLVHEELDPGILLGDVLDALEPLIAGLGAQITAESLEPVVGDRRLMRVLLQNLLHNALRYRHPDRPPRIDVTTRRTAEHWTLAVRDNGRGVPEASRDHLFDPFVLGSPDVSTHASGIGLATCRRIAERHGGTLEARHLEDGTQFVLRVPLEPPSGGG